MSFLSRRVNLGPQEAWAKNTWFLQTSNWSFRLSSNPKKKQKKNKVIKKKNPQATHAIKGSTGLIWKVSKSHLEKKPCDAPSTPNVRLQLSSKAARISTWTYLCKIFLLRITAWTERFKSDWRERQRDSIVRSQTHKRTLKHVFCKTTVF